MSPRQFLFIIYYFLPEGGLHDLADALVGEEEAHPAQDEQLQHLQDLHQDHLVRSRVTSHKSINHKKFIMSVVDCYRLRFLIAQGSGSGLQ
jgi:hypothetical protein